MDHRAGIFCELHAVVLPVKDMEASRRFYEEVLGFEPLKVLPGGFMTVYGTGGPSHVCLYVAEPGGEELGRPRPGSFPNFRTDDIDATRRHLVEAGVGCGEIGEGGGVRWFEFQDPDGNRIDACEYGPDWLP